MCVWGRTLWRYQFRSSPVRTAEPFTSWTRPKAARSPAATMFPAALAARQCPVAIASSSSNTSTVEIAGARKDREASGAKNRMTGKPGPTRFASPQDGQRAFGGRIHDVGASARRSRPLGCHPSTCRVCRGTSSRPMNQSLAEGREVLFHSGALKDFYGNVVFYQPLVPRRPRS